MSNNSTHMKRSHLAILINILIWIPRCYSIGIFFLPGVNLSAQPVKTNFLLSLESNTLLFITFYIFYFFFSRLLLSKQKEKMRYALWFGSIVIFIITAIGYGLQNIIARDYMGISNLYWLVDNFILVLYTAFSSCLMKGFLNWYSDIFYKRQLEKKNLETELALLKAQINPHFLFNTLNNIDVLIEKDAKTASIYLKKLSGILRFMLYESPTEKVALTQEVEYIKEYIELQKIRTSNPDFVSFTVTGDTDNMQIAPMLFIPFIENAFKHCTNKKINNAVEITLAVHDKEIDFTCSNAFEQSALPTQERSGLGLDLIRNRLNLLYKNHQLNIDKTNNRFSIALSIKPDDN